MTTLPGKFYAWLGRPVELLTLADKGTFPIPLVLPLGLLYFVAPPSIRLELPRGISPAVPGIWDIAVPGFLETILYDFLFAAF